MPVGIRLSDADAKRQATIARITAIEASSESATTLVAGIQLPSLSSVSTPMKFFRVSDAGETEGDTEPATDVMGDLVDDSVASSLGESRNGENKRNTESAMDVMGDLADGSVASSPGSSRDGEYENEDSDDETGDSDLALSAVLRNATKGLKLKRCNDVTVLVVLGGLNTRNDWKAASSRGNADDSTNTGFVSGDFHNDEPDCDEAQVCAEARKRVAAMMSDVAAPLPEGDRKRPRT